MDNHETPLTASTRSHTPDSPIANSLYQATATVEDITAALSNYSRVQTPEPPYLQRCCCLREDCEHSKAWLAFKAKLENRLVLSAEVGQALLRKHEAYLRRHYQAVNVEIADPGRRSPSLDDSSILDMDFSMERRVATLLEENAKLEKQLNSALLNAEVIESENKVLSHNLQEAKVTITRLNTVQAKTLGMDARLSTALQDIDDLRQELDGEENRANVAESRLSTLSTKYSRVKNELRRCIEELEHQKLSRSELSDEVLKDARARLDMLQQSHLGHSLITQDTELIKIMESLVTDNEALKRDTAELQNLLGEAREDVRSLREENGELKVGASSALADGIRIAQPLRHRYTSSLQSNLPFAADRIVPISPRFSSSAFHRLPSPSRIPSDRGRSDARGKPRSRHSSLDPSGQHTYEPLTPETQLRPLSPAGSSAGYEQQSHISYEVDSASVRAGTPDSPEKRRAPRRPLLLLTQNRGVQTDEWVGFLGGTLQATPTGNASSIPPSDGRSESSSLIDPLSSTMAALIDRVNTSFTRITQADALTLKNRLKRQHLPSDVGHLSRTTVNSILSDINGLRSHFRAILEDDKVPCTCTRKDLRNILRLFKDMFNELGEMRIILNDVIMNPSIAVRVSQMALEPSKVADAERGRNTSVGIGSMGSWMAPISKLFGAASGPSSQHSTPNKAREKSPHHPARSATPALALHRPIPRSGPALGASNAIVNVEFSGAGLSRTTAVASTNIVTGVADIGSVSHVDGLMPLPNQSRQFLDIFAGAPRNSQEDNWIVLPNSSPQKASQKTLVSSFGSSKPTTLKSMRRMSRNVDAVIDSPISTLVSTVHEDEGDDMDANGANYEGGNLLKRTLRPRGLSDSSIHTTFLNSGGDNNKSTLHQLPPHALLSSGNSIRQGPYPDGHDRQSVLRSLSQKIQNFKASSSLAVQSQAPSMQSDYPDSTNTIGENLQRATSPSKIIDINILPNLASWAATKAGFDHASTDEFSRSFKEDAAFSAGQRKLARGGLDL